LSPGLPTRTDTLTFEGETAEFASEESAGSAGAVDADVGPGSVVISGSEASDTTVGSAPCVSAPSPPGLETRTETFMSPPFCVTVAVVGAG